MSWTAKTLYIFLDFLQCAVVFWFKATYCFYKFCKSEFENRFLTEGNVHKGCPIFFQFLEICTYILTYVLCPIYYLLMYYFLDVPTYPKIEHPLWTFPKEREANRNCRISNRKWLSGPSMTDYLETRRKPPETQSGKKIQRCSVAGFRIIHHWQSTWYAICCTWCLWLRR